MPSFRVETPNVELNIFDVVGEDVDQRGFISHTGLAESEDSQSATAVKVLDMGPPLHGPSQTFTMKASAVGSAELTDDEVRKIRTFVQLHTNEHQAFRYLTGSLLFQLASQMYCIYPHSSQFSEEDGRYVRMRFSCSGFVFEAYKFARINLLEISTLPMVDMNVLRAAYPRHVRLMDNNRITADSLGLVGQGPWRVLLCGYILHALNRTADQIREQSYTPSEVDQRFPHE